MSKDLGGFMQKFAGSLGSQLGGGGMSGLSQIGGPMSGIGILGKLMGGGDEPEQNPGQAMFDGQGGAKKNPGFLEKFGGSLSDQLFQKAMMGFMGR